MPRKKWWGYLHRNNEIQLKRWFGDVRDYTEDCYGNPNVLKVVEPFEADEYEQAYLYLQNELRN